MKKKGRKPLSNFPKGWNQERVQKVIDHYENQTNDEAVAQDEAAWHDPKYTTMSVPIELVPQVQRLIARQSI